MKEAIYDKEITNYKELLTYFYSSLVLSTLCICTLAKGIEKFGVIAIISFIVLFLSYIEFHLVSKKHGEYRLVYKEDKKGYRELFPKSS